MTLDEIVSDYIREYREGARAEMDTFRNEKSRTSAIRRAALCESPDGKRHPHQYRIPRRLLRLAEGRLQTAARRLTNAADFEVLHMIVGTEIGAIHGIGRLMVYDVAQRIGAFFGKYPRRIYLHRGTKQGAAVLGFRGETLDPALLPPAFSRLSAAEIEDCLCIYKDHFAGVNRKRLGLHCVIARQSHGCVK